MQGFKVFLLVLIVLLLGLFMLDRSREPRQVKELIDSLDQAQMDFQRLRASQEALLRGQGELVRSMEQLSTALDAFRRGFAEGVTVGRGGAPAIHAPETEAPREQPAPTAQITRDGVPVLGHNFLLPYDRSPFEPERLHGELRAFAQEPTTLNTVITSMGATSAIVNMVSDSLCSTRPEDPSRWQEGLATAVVIDDNFKRFTFTLRPDVYWHIPTMARESGREWLRERVPVTAHDFVFFLRMVNDGEVNAPHLRVYYSKASARAIDDYTLEVIWEESEYTNIQFTLGMSPLARHIYIRNEDGSEMPESDWGVAFNEHWFDRAWGLVGTGPYRLQAFAPRRQVEFRRNHDYWGVTDHFERITWDLSVTQEDAQLTAFKNNQVHSYGLRPGQWKAEVLDGHEPRFAAYDPENHPKAGRESPFGWEIVGSNRWSGICWNTRRPQLADPRVRQALAHAYDYERIKSEVWFGLAQRSIGPIHPSSPYFNADTPAFTFDLARAAALLDEAGWVDSNGDGWRDRMIDGRRVTLRIAITYYAQARVWANVVSLFAETCRQIGVQIVPSPVEDQEWARRADNRDFDGFMVVWTSGLDVDFMQLWHSSGADEPQSSNYASYINREADVGMEALRTTFDPEQRYAIAAQVADQIYRDQPYLFLSVGRGVFAWHNTPYTQAVDRRQRLGGVTHGFDHYHPLFTTDRSRWFLQRE
ncbi:MAG: hypothetical protein EA402_08725 [Planctomycetota bacterium]|nr:MAG: hypothetical protein EA402_08725 [Planctomycetota bacterium]